MGRGNKATALKIETSNHVIDPAETELLLEAAAKHEVNFEIRAIKQGLSRLLSKYKESSNKTNKEIGFMLGISESQVSKMLRTIDQFTIDSYVERLSKIEDDTIQKRLKMMGELAKL